MDKKEKVKKIRFQMFIQLFTLFLIMAGLIGAVWIESWGYVFLFLGLFFIVSFWIDFNIKRINKEMIKNEREEYPF